MTRCFAAAVAALACAWFAWFLFGSVRVTVSVPTARIEAAQVGHALQAPVSGYLVGVLKELGARVERGDVVFQLDASPEEREQRKKIAEQAALRAQRDALKQEIRAVEGALAAEREAVRVSVVEAELRQREAEDLAAFREQQQLRKVDLANAGVLALSDLLQSASDATQQRTEAEARAVAAERIRADHGVSRAERVERLAALRREAASLEGKLTTLATELLDVEHRREERRVRATIAGSLGELAPLTAGAFVQQGDTLGTIIPNGQLRIVAQLPPEEAFGRIRAGQPARMRLAGFPWTQYGSVSARVTRVAEEVREGLVRVELAITGRGPRGVLLQHGLTGSIEIDVEQAAPAALLFRAGGRALPGAPAPRPTPHE